MQSLRTARFRLGLGELASSIVLVESSPADWGLGAWGSSGGFGAYRRICCLDA